MAQNIPTTANLGGVTTVASIEGVNYFVAPDADLNQAVYVAQGKKPFYFSKGQLGEDGSAVGTGPWSEPQNVETRGTHYGYRDYVNMGVKDPTAVAVVDYV